MHYNTFQNTNTIFEVLSMMYRNLNDNIYPEEFNARAEGILNWTKENRLSYDWAKDPNAYEMVNLFLLGSKYSNEGQNIDKSTLNQLWEIRSQDFEPIGILSNSFIYKICEDAFLSSQEGKPLVNDEASHHALRKMAGLGLYLSQQKRDGQEIQYNNPSELLELLEASRTLKGVHPELFEKYKFDKNLEALVRLQPENALSDRINHQMQQLSGKQEVNIQNNMILSTDEIEK